MNAEHLLTHFDRLTDAPDAIPRLRRFILDLAVRGKLVEQDPSEGTGSSLLTEIKRGQIVLLSSQRLKKTHRLEGLSFSDVPFQVPKNWALVRLGQALDLVNGRAFKPSDWTQTGLPIVRIQNLNNPSAAFNRYDGEVKEKFLIDSGDFLISWSGTPGTSFGAHIWTGGPAVLNQHIFKAILIGNAFEPHFLKLAINARLLELIEQAHGGVGLQHITKPKLEAVVLTLPPLAEQHRIVAKVDELMALCDRLETERKEQEATRDRLATASLARLNAPDPDPAIFQNHAAFALNNLTPLTTRPDQIKALRQTILNLAVRGKLVEQDPEDEPAGELLKRVAREKKRLVEAGEIKKTKPTTDLTSSISGLDVTPGWVITSLQSVCASITDGDHLPPPKTESGIPFLVIGNVRSQTINFAGSRFVSPEYYEALDPIRRPRSGDLLYTLVGSYGIPVVVRDEQPFCVQRHIGILRPSKLIDVGFLARVMESRLVFEQATACATGIAQKTIPLSGLRRLLIPLPPLAEQRRIVAKVDELIAVCDRLEASLAAGEETRGRLVEAVLWEALETDGEVAA